MTIDEAVFAYLSTYSGLTALVGKRIYPDDLPQNPTYPAVTFIQVSEDEIDTLHQPASTMIGATYQFDCWATTRVGAKAVARQIRAAWKNYSGITGGVGGVTVSAVEIVNGDMDNSYRDSDGKLIAYVTTREHKIWYQEVV